MRALVVLGCRVRLDGEGRLHEGTLRRRVALAAEKAREGALVIASGGRRWEGQVEADVMAKELERHGVPEGAIVRERLSMTTEENARFVAELLARRGRSRATVVTSDWHLARALMLFRRAGVDVDGVPVIEPAAAWRPRLWRWGRERALASIQSAPSR